LQPWINGVLQGFVTNVDLTAELLYQEKWLDLRGVWHLQLIGDPQELAINELIYE
jgi:hypothetical protein